MNKRKKYQQQLQSAKAGIRLFYQDSLLLTDYEDLQNHLNLLASYFKQVENDKAVNKNVIVFQTYLKKESLKKQTIKAIKKKAKLSWLKNKLSFLDYLEDYEILRARGLSYQKIADYSKKYFKCQVSKETVRKYLNIEEKIQDDK